MGSAGAMIAAFAFGGFVATAMVDIGHGRPLGVVGPAAIAFGALVLNDVIILLALQEEASARDMALVTSLSAFALGVQNVVSGRAPCLATNTTFMTGTVKRISEGAWAFVSGQLRGDDRRNLKLLLWLWLFYVVGGIVGGAAFAPLPVVSPRPLLDALPLLPAAIVQGFTLLMLRWLDPEPAKRRCKKPKVAMVSPAPSRSASRDPSPAPLRRPSPRPPPRPPPRADDVLFGVGAAATPRTVDIVMTVMEGEGKDDARAMRRPPGGRDQVHPSVAEEAGRGPNDRGGGRCGGVDELSAVDVEQ
jgi:hypothetical protein